MKKVLIFTVIASLMVGVFGCSGEAGGNGEGGGLSDYDKMILERKQKYESIIAPYKNDKYKDIFKEKKIICQVEANKNCESLFSEIGEADYKCLELEMQTEGYQLYNSKSIFEGMLWAIEEDSYDINAGYEKEVIYFPSDGENKIREVIQEHWDDEYVHIYTLMEGDVSYSLDVFLDLDDVFFVRSGIWQKKFLVALRVYEYGIKLYEIRQASDSEPCFVYYKTYFTGEGVKEYLPDLFNSAGGETGDTVDENLIGEWTFSGDRNYNMITFAADGNFTAKYAQDSNYSNPMVRTGTYAVKENGKIELKCSGLNLEETLSYNLSGNSLTISSDNQFLTATHGALFKVQQNTITFTK